MVGAQCAAPVMIACRNEGGIDARHTRAHAGQAFHLDEPVEVPSDPAELLDDWQ